MENKKEMSCHDWFRHCSFRLIKPELVDIQSAVIVQCTYNENKYLGILFTLSQETIMILFLYSLRVLEFIYLIHTKLLPFSLIAEGNYLFKTSGVTKNFGCDGAQP